MRRFALLPGAALLLAAAGIGPAAPAAAQSAPLGGDAPPPRVAEAVPVPAAVRAAVGRGTRTATGQPGERYWQQGVSYRIEAELDPASARLRGRERITYHNRSPVPLATMVLNLYQNLYTAEVPRNRATTPTGGVTLERVAVAGEGLARLPASHLEGIVRRRPAEGTPPGYVVEGTLAWLVLSRPVAPGDSVVLEVAWHQSVPRAPGFRTAYEEAPSGRVFLVAQWYPQVAVFDDLHGWDATPYLGDGEFYLEYGDFDVSLTLPAGWLAGASGTLQNPDEVLAPVVRRRLAAAMRSDTTVHVVTAAERGAGATRSSPTGKLTWRFRAEDVRDFAFAASDGYLWDVAAGGSGRSVPVHALYRPGNPAWARVAYFGKRAAESYGRLLTPYAYPQLSVLEGPLSGGMEYPQVVFLGMEGGKQELAGVVAHEVGHQWFPMVVGHDEAAYAWMDEGLVTWMHALPVAEILPGVDPLAMERRFYLSVAGQDVEAPVMRHTDLVSPYGVRYVAAYSKPGVLLGSLRAVLGEETFMRALRAYAGEWRFRHPTPWDFFHTFERVSGRKLDWFFHPWWFGTGTFDLAVRGAEPSGDGTVRVTVELRGAVAVPATVVATTVEGTRFRAEIPVEAWARERTATVSVAVRGRLASVEVDPEQVFPELDRANNVWRPAR